MDIVVISVGIIVVITILKDKGIGQKKIRIQESNIEEALTHVGFIDVDETVARSHSAK